MIRHDAAPWPVPADKKVPVGIIVQADKVTPADKINVKAII